MFEEDLDVFLGDFADDILGPSSVQCRGIIEAPARVVDLGDVAIATDEYELTLKRSDLASLKSGDEITVQTGDFAGSYKVREPLAFEDGKFKKVLLSRVS